MITPAPDRLVRRLLAVLAVSAVVAAMVPVYAGVAAADVTPADAVASNCVKFDFGEEAEGTITSPIDFPYVEVTLDDWYDTEVDPHKIDFTIAGLLPGQYVRATTKSGSEPLEVFGPFGDGTHTVTSELKWAISHVTFCVFADEPTTTTVAETTTTVEETTTTVEETTTTTVEETTTTVEETTTTEGAEVLPTVVTTAPDEVDDDELPYTGIDANVMAGLAVLLLGAGAAMLAGTRRAEDS